MDTIISVRNLRKVYTVGSEKVVALNEINLEIGRGQICCIVGTSGSGKSTLLNQLAGLEKPTKGGVFIGGHNISRFSEDQLARFRQKYIGFIFQSYNLMNASTALENVAMPLMFRGVGRSERNRRATAMLKAVGLNGRIHHRPSQMSGGQQQRVGIARAFVARPAIVFADEPTGNLDTRTTLEVMEMMVRMAREYKQTFILVTHDQYLSQFADRIITLIDGNIVSDVENVSIVDRLDPEQIEEQYKAQEEEQAADPNESLRALAVARVQEQMETTVAEPQQEMLLETEALVPNEGQAASQTEIEVSTDEAAPDWAMVSPMEKLEPAEDKPADAELPLSDQVEASSGEPSGQANAARRKRRNKRKGQATQQVDGGNER